LDGKRWIGLHNLGSLPRSFSPPRVFFLNGWYAVRHSKQESFL